MVFTFLLLGIIGLPATDYFKNSEPPSCAFYELSHTRTALSSRINLQYKLISVENLNKKHILKLIKKRANLLTEAGQIINLIPNESYSCISDTNCQHKDLSTEFSKLRAVNKNLFRFNVRDFDYLATRNIITAKKFNIMNKKSRKLYRQTLKLLKDLPNVFSYCSEIYNLTEQVCENILTIPVDNCNDGKIDDLERCSNSCLLDNLVYNKEKLINKIPAKSDKQILSDLSQIRHQGFHYAPGIIQAEDFDFGEPGIAYFDLTSENILAKQYGIYRDSGVDIWKSGNSWRLGSTFAGEWIQYTINALETDDYDIWVLGSNTMPGGKFRFELNGKRIGSSLSFPVTKSWHKQNWISIKKIRIPKGQHKLRLIMESNSSNGGIAGSFDLIEIAPYYSFEMHSLESMYEDMAKWQIQYPNLIKVVEVGKTVEKRPILAAQLSNFLSKSFKTKYLHTEGGIHPNENLAIEVNAYFIYKVLVNYGIDTRVTTFLDQGEIWVVPIVNPDGKVVVDLAHKGLPGGFLAQRKNKRDTNGDSKYSFGGYENERGDGVDLNRNFGTNWENAVQTARDPLNSRYRGEAPYSEPETEAMIRLMASRPFKYAIEFHCCPGCGTEFWYFRDGQDAGAHTQLVKNMAKVGFPSMNVDTITKATTIIAGVYGTGSFMQSAYNPDPLRGKSKIFSSTVEVDRCTDQPYIPGSLQNFAKPSSAFIDRSVRSYVNSLFYLLGDPIACISDKHCEDGNPKTRNSCINPGKFSSYCNTVSSNS